MPSATPAETPPLLRTTYSPASAQCSQRLISHIPRTRRPPFARIACTAGNNCHFPPGIAHNVRRRSRAAAKRVRPFSNPKPSLLSPPLPPQCRSQECEEEESSFQAVRRAEKDPGDSTRKPGREPALRTHQSAASPHRCTAKLQARHAANKRSLS